MSAAAALPFLDRPPARPLPLSRFQKMNNYQHQTLRRRRRLSPSRRLAARYPPPRWLETAAMCGSVIERRFVAFKTPLCAQYESYIPDAADRFSPRDSIRMARELGGGGGGGVGGRGLAAVISLTNTDRFYDPAEFTGANIEHHRLPCKGRDEVPTDDTLARFIRICRGVIGRTADALIGVHCTHGFNRTGYLIACYLIEFEDCSVSASVDIFRRCRPPGIGKRDYVAALYAKFNEKMPPPEQPDAAPRLTHADAAAATEFAVPARGVALVDSADLARDVQSRIVAMAGCKALRGFVGSQPVSMTVDNIRLMYELDYRVSWKADGTRYLCMIDGLDQVFMLDRKNAVFHVHELRFFHRKEPERHLKRTLVDGELVVDKVNGLDVYRYLIYDIICFEGNDVGEDLDFDRRLRCILVEIVEPRHRAISEGRIQRHTEPFSVRLKDFWKLEITHKLLADKFTKQLGHEIDGLIFQPVHMPYIFATCRETLKWKPIHLNSIDFRLRIIDATGPIGYLYVKGRDKPFSHIEVTPDLRQHDGKILECAWIDRKWSFIRVREDKPNPNTFRTALAITKSIEQPVTEQLLFDTIKAVDKSKFVLSTLDEYWQMIRSGGDSIGGGGGGGGGDEPADGPSRSAKVSRVRV